MEQERGPKAGWNPFWLSSIIKFAFLISCNIFQSIRTDYALQKEWRESRICTCVTDVVSLLVASSASCISSTLEYSLKQATYRDTWSEAPVCLYSSHVTRCKILTQMDKSDFFKHPKSYITETLDHLNKYLVVLYAYRRMLLDKKKIFQLMS